MTIVGIAGSPREGGNTEVLLQEALKAVQEEAETTFISLAEVKVPPYVPGTEPPEGVAEILDLLQEADAHILGTPSYFGMVSGTLKDLLDWTADLWQEGAFRGKVGAAMAVERDTGGELAAQALSNYFAMHRMIFAGSVVARGHDRREVLYDVRSVRAARELVTSVLELVGNR